MASEKLITGIYGGSFNPIHNGHVAIARQMLRHTDMKEVWLMVSPQNPLKPSSALLDDGLRLDMARRAVAGVEGVTASDYEFALPRPSYTWTTLQSLCRDHPEREFALIIGADNWKLFDRWYHASDIIATHRIFIFPRRGYSVDASSLPSGVSLVDTGLYDMSSTQVRQAVADGDDISKLVPSAIVRMVKKYYAH